MKEPRLRAIRATVRKRARAWLAVLGLVAFCLLCSPLRGAFSPWSVHAKDTCMAVGGKQKPPELLLDLFNVYVKLKASRSDSAWCC